MASIEVLCAHSAFGYFGAVGVDIFFILSGFLIAMIIEQRSNFNEKGSINVIRQSARKFWLSRYFRVAPIYYFYTFLAIALGVGVPESLTHLITSFAMIKTPAYTSPVLSVGWTLEYEFALYCMATLAIFACNKIIPGKIKPIYALIFFLAVATIVVDLILFPTKMYGHFLEFLMGCVSYLLYKSSPHKVNSLLGGVSLMFIGTTFAFFGAKHFYEIMQLRFVFLGIPALVILWGALFLEKTIRNSKENVFVSCLLKLGASSYTLYLSHIFILNLGRIMLVVERSESILIEAFLVVSSILISIPLFTQVEKKITVFCKDRFLISTI